MNSFDLNGAARPSFGLKKVCQGDGYSIQKRGVTEYPGLFFVGLPWLHNAKSGLIYGVGEDAAYIAQRITINERRSSARDTQETDDPHAVRA